MARIKNLQGMKFGRLTIKNISHKDKRNNIMWNAVCDCGNSTVVRASNLLRGTVRSCGCLAKENASQRSKTHGKSYDSIYRIWLNMITRTSNKKDVSYEHYGGRGIEVCERWHDFNNFYADMGDKPNGKTLDRIDVNGDYCKENCRWATSEQQCNNKTNNHFLTYKGETKTVSQWSRYAGIKAQTLFHRINIHNWSIEDALTTPTRKKRHNMS